MTTILATTVGGSCAPIVTAIKDYSPDAILFFATTGERGSRITIDGPKKPCRRRTSKPDTPKPDPNILAQSDYTGEYTIIELDDPDSFVNCYETMRQSLQEYQRKYPDARLIADYTGGTKTMGATLVLAALEAGWQISLVKGTRADLVQVLDGSEMAGLVNSWDVHVQLRVSEAERLFNQFAYVSAGTLLESLLRERPVRSTLAQKIRELVAICRGFDAWDKFNHAQAINLLEPFRSQFVPQWRFLTTLDNQKPSGYAPVLDLLRNAQRRAQRGRYDDAVARLYRALEMFAQIRLDTEYQINSSNVLLDRLPDNLRSAYRSKTPHAGSKIKLGLVEDYKLLQDLGDPVGEVYGTVEKKLRNALSHRNASILAHGITPLGKNDFQEMYNTVDGFFQQATKQIGSQWKAPQFPLLQDGKFQQRENARISQLND